MNLKARAARFDDAAAIAMIYNEGIVDRIATFETEPQSAEQIVHWFDGKHPIVVEDVLARATAEQRMSLSTIRKLRVSLPDGKPCR